MFLYALTPRLLSHFTHLYNIFLTKPSFSMNGNSRNPIQFLKPTTNSGKLLFSIRVKSNGKPHYNPSARIIDPVSHTTYVGVNFIHKWLDLQFKANSERQTFWETFHGNFYFILRVFGRNLLRGNRRRNTFRILFWCLALGSNPGFSSHIIY